MDRQTILGLKLKEYRKRNGLSQANMAELLEVSDKTISKWELGQTCPSKRNMIKLTKTIDISLETLLFDEKTAQTRSILAGVGWATIAFLLNLAILFMVSVLSGGKIMLTQSLHNILLSIPVAAVVGFAFAWYFYPKKD